MEVLLAKKLINETYAVKPTPQVYLPHDWFVGHYDVSHQAAEINLSKSVIYTQGASEKHNFAACREQQIESRTRSQQALKPATDIAPINPAMLKTQTILFIPEP